MFRTPFQLQPPDPDFEFGTSDAQAHLVPPERQPPDLGDMRAHDVALSHLNARGFIQFHPMLAQRLEDFKAAIFLGHALYWSKYLAQAQPHRKGWFFMSAAQWTVATGLSAREQNTVRANLVERGLLLEALAGRPAVMHYKVELDAAAALLGLPTMAWDDMTELFRSAIRFYKPLADICGNVGAGLYLSYLLHRQSFALRNPPQDNSVEMFPGEFTYRPEQARIALCLGTKAQRNAREKLKSAGFIREGRSSQEVVSTRVNLMAIASCLQAQGERSIKKSAPRKPASPKALQDIALVKATGGSSSKRAATLQRAGGAEANRQLRLFTPMGLIAQWSADPSTDNHLSTQDDAASLVNAPTTGTTASSLVMSLFAPGKSVAIHPSSTEVKLSTDADTSGNHDALLSVPICPFVGPNLPFCRNYIEQGISRYFQTTTTAPAPVDNFTGEKTSRRRIEKSKTDENQNSETAARQKIDSKRPIQASDGLSDESGWGDSMPRSKSLKTVEIQAAAIAGDQSKVVSAFAESGQALVLPSGLDALTGASVLNTVAKAPEEMRQTFLDELAGHLSIPSKTIHNPSGWLHGLIRRHAEGFVVLAMAPQVAALRAKRQQHQDRLANVSPEPSASVATKPSQVEDDSEIKRTTLQRLQELKASFASSKGGRR